MSPAAEEILRRLDAARQKWWLFTLLCTTAIGVCVSAAALLVFVLLDALLHFSQIGLTALFGTWLAITAALMVAIGRRLLGSERSLEGTARRVEMEIPELGLSLIHI